MTRILLSLLFAASLGAETIYVSDQGSGTGSGADTSNYMSISGFNTAGNWDTDVANDGKIGPGDTVVFSGTITNQAVIQGSGSGGNPITLTFASGAKFSKPAWTSTGAIYATDKDYITIDGANIGAIGAHGATDPTTWETRIECTDNGDGLGNMVATIRGIYFLAAGGGGCGNILIQNMRIKDIFVRTPNGTNSVDGGSGIMVESDGNATIFNNYVENNENGFYLKGVGTNVTGLNVVSNTATKISNGIHFACKSANHTTSGGSVVGNRINLTDTWCGGPHHNDGIQTISSQSGNRIYRLHIAMNWIGPDFGTDGDANAPIFLEDGVVECYIYNNFIEIGAGEVLSNPAITAGTGASYWTGSDAEGLIANNTLLGNGGNLGIRGPRMIIKGNVVYNFGYGMSNEADRSDQDVDYQVYFPTGTDFYDNDVGIYANLTSWKAAGWDANSIAQDPLINSNGTLQSSSPAIDFVPWAAAQTYTNIVSSDFYGNVRPVGSAWNAGAFEGTNAPSGGSSRALSSQIGGRATIRGRVIIQ